ncbi:MAG TPA: site-2 protease family protein [Nitrososphaeraceae archaeon]|nr:site-2 protease family protein [Nitrososphaeraceae archaeon]
MERPKKIHAEVKFPLILIHTPFGLEFFNKVAATKAAKLYAKVNVFIMPLITALAIFLIVGSLMVMFSNSAAREGVRSVGPQSNLLIPGLNPYLPWTYGWLALVITIIIHEVGHGIVARVHGIPVESTGIVLILGIPIGAFVNIEREQLMKTTLRQKSAILTAGPLNNMILAAICLLALYLVVSTLSPLPTRGETHIGVLVMSVNDGSLAKSVGLSQGSVIKSIAGKTLHSVEDLNQILRSSLGNKVNLTWQDKNGKETTRGAMLPEIVQGNKAILGVTITNVTPDPASVLQKYKSAFNKSPISLLLPPTMAQGNVPFSDLMTPKYESKILGSSFPIFANILFWLWFINFNVGIFNALPIGPLDGGQLYTSLIENKTSSRTGKIKNAPLLLTVIMTTIVIISLFLPWVIR